jgi:DNA helicase HerA-like ATPase
MKARASFKAALRSIFEREGRWTVYVDELALAADPRWYDLGDELERMWAQGRSLGISLVTNTQRPARIPPLAYTQISHLFMGQTADKRDAERLSEIGGMDRRDTIDLLTDMPKFTFAYRNVRDRTTVSTRPPKRA